MGLAPLPTWVREFFYYGYLLPSDGSGLPIRVPPIPAVRCNVPIDELVRVGAERLTAAFERTLAKESLSGGEHIVPLSGGLDSRAVLGALLTFLSPQEVVGVTYGTPGTWDYEYAKLVAKQAGIRLVAFDLQSDDWTWDAAVLGEGFSVTHHPVPVLELYINRSIPRYFGKNNLFWSGFLGEAISGGHLPPRSCKTPADACKHFVVANRYTRSVPVSPPRVPTPQCVRSIPSITSYEQLDLAIRQTCYIRPIVMPGGFRYAAPLTVPEWTDYVLGIERKYHRDQWFYRRVIARVAPQLAALPTKNHYGAAVTAGRLTRFVHRARHHGRTVSARIARRPPTTRPAANYLNFGAAMRERRDLREVVEHCVEVMSRRQQPLPQPVWTYWKAHRSGAADHADLLQLVASVVMFEYFGPKRMCDDGRDSNAQAANAAPTE